MKVSLKEAPKNMINDVYFKIANNIYHYLKNIFEGALQKTLEVKLEVELGIQSGIKRTKYNNRKNSTFSKSLRLNLQ